MCKLSRYNLVWLLGVLLPGNLAAQMPIARPDTGAWATAAAERYAQYRERFMRHFVLVSPRLADYDVDTTRPPLPERSGYSIPVAEAWMDYSFYRWQTQPLDAFIHYSHQNLKFADATSFLGFYIAVLATEYARLRAQQAPDAELQATAVELYKALKTYERLDYSAEFFYDLKTHPRGLNGFFLRDDVNPDTFFPRFHLGKPGMAPLASSRAVLSDYALDDFAQFRDTEGGYGAIFDERSTKPLATAMNPMSQDQCIWLLMGFALTAKVFADVAPLTLTDAEGTVRRAQLGEMARGYGRQIVTYISSHGTAWNGGWGIRFPGTQTYVMRGGRGLELGFDSYGFAQAYYNLTGQRIRRRFLPSVVLSYAYFQSLKRPWAPVYRSQGFNRSMLMCLAAIGDGFRDNRDVVALHTFTVLGVLSYPTPLFHLFASRALHCSRPNRCRSVTLHCLNDLAVTFQMPLFPLLHRFLYAKSYPAPHDSVVFATARDFIARAPAYGPCIRQGEQRLSGPWPWNTSNVHQYVYRAEHPPELSLSRTEFTLSLPKGGVEGQPGRHPEPVEGVEGGGRPAEGAAFNGLDYLLLYNLLWLVGI